MFVNECTLFYSTRRNGLVGKKMNAVSPETRAERVKMKKKEKNAKDKQSSLSIL